jgi:hypothetical protein
VSPYFVLTLQADGSGDGVGSARWVGNLAVGRSRNGQSRVLQRGIEESVSTRWRQGQACHPVARQGFSGNTPFGREMLRIKLRAALAVLLNGRAVARLLRNGRRVRQLACFC